MQAGLFTSQNIKSGHCEEMSIRVYYFTAVLEY